MELITINEIVAVIRLVPKGITEEGKFRFAIVIAIDSINDEYKQLSFDCLMEAASKIGTLLNPKNFNSNFGIYFKNESKIFELKYPDFNIEGSPFDQLNGGNHWSKFFSNPEVKIVINKFKTPEGFTNPDNPFEFVYDDEIECCDPCDNDVIGGLNGEHSAPPCDTRDDLQNRIDSADRYFEKIESFYDNNYSYKKERLKNTVDLSDGKTFLFSEILSQIYQNPRLNNEIYGVSLSLEITIENLDLFNNEKGELILTKKDCNNTFIKTEVLEEGEDGTLVFDGKEECILSVYDDYIINRVDIFRQLLPKYYHGRSNYGLVDLNKDSYEWKFLSKIQDWNNQLATTSEGLDKTNAEKVEGIILYHKLTKEQYIETFQKVGVNGHEILCQFEDEINSYLGSLCERKVKYELSNNGEISHEERSSIKIDTAIMMGNQLDLKNNEVFKWEGYNLCLPKSGMQVTENEKPVNKLDNIKNYNRDHDEFEDFFENTGFTYSHKFINDSNIYLNDLSHVSKERKHYTFYILNCDAVTGYRLPIGNLKESNGSPVLDLATLLKEGLLNNNLKIPFKDPHEESSEFSITPKNSPLYPVHILDRVEHSSKEPKDIEKNNHIILNENNATLGSERFIIPDSISFHFSQLLGLTDNSFIQENDRTNYLKKVYSVFKRGQIKVPKVYFENKIKYLPDFRNTHIIIRPDNWKSWMLLRNVFSGEIKQQIFFYQSSFEDFFNSLKPYTIKVKSSGSISSNTLELEFKKEITCRIPMYSILHLRLYSANISEHFSNYREVSFSNVGDGVEKPSISEYKQPIDAQRCLPDNNNNTFVFFAFNVKQDPRRDYLTLVTESRELIDDGYSAPELDKSLETDLANEYSREIFSTVIGDLKSNETKEVFPNKIGVCYKFSRNLFNLIAGLNDNSAETIDFSIFSIEINKDFVINFRADFQEYILMVDVIRNNEIKELGGISEGGVLIIDYQSLPYGLFCKIIYQRKKENGVFKRVLFSELIYSRDLPNIDFSEKNIKVNNKVEELIIGSIKNKDDFNLELNCFELQNNIYQETKNSEAEYFVYRNEEDNKFRKLKFKLKSYSKFKKYYPQTQDYPWSKFTAVGNEEYMSIIPNNEKPQTPVFNFVPLFYKEESNSTKSTENPICIRINRPQSEDLIGIVDAKYDAGSGKFITTQNTSSIARDITKSVNGKTLEDNTLNNYLNGLNPLDTNVYYQGKIEVKIDNSLFRLILFKPHYNFKEKQYQIILPFDYHKFGKLDDPIAKIVLTRVQQRSIASGDNNNLDNLKVSKFSNAKFIPIRSKRIVSIHKVSNTKHEVTIKKNNSTSSENSIFVIGYFKPRQEDFGELVREIIPVKKEQSNEVVDYILVKDKILKEKYIIEADDSNAQVGSISVFEIEKHNDNEKVILDMESGKVNFNNNPLLRMIYAEAFPLKSEEEFHIKT